MSSQLKWFMVWQLIVNVMLMVYFGISHAPKADFVEGSCNYQYLIEENQALHETLTAYHQELVMVDSQIIDKPEPTKSTK